jgi:hypothetical protein
MPIAAAHAAPAAPPDVGGLFDAEAPEIPCAPRRIARAA